MEQLLEDYKKRLKTVMEMFSNATNEDERNRLRIKQGCYRTFIHELEAIKREAKE